MNEVIEKENIEIKDMIYEIRGMQVILDRDISKLYNVETRVLLQTVKRNINRFPKNFMFQLSYDEFIDWRSQNVMSKNDIIGLRRAPYAFTEYGIIMLSGLLKSDIATKVNIKVINAFVALRQYVSNNLLGQKYINELVLKDSKRIDLIEETLSNFKEKNNHIFFEGQIYDSYSIMLDILNTSTNSIIIIDNYLDKNILDILSKINKRITLITNKYNNEDYNKYKEQYSNIDLVINNKIHDRFIIIDKKVLYHCGASFKDLGKKCFAITKINDSNILANLLENLKMLSY